MKRQHGSITLHQIDRRTAFSVLRVVAQCIIAQCVNAFGVITMRPFSKRNASDKQQILPYITQTGMSSTHQTNTYVFSLLNASSTRTFGSAQLMRIESSFRNFLPSW
jgi:hypothetical protein